MKRMLIAFGIGFFAIAASFAAEDEAAFPWKDYFPSGLVDSRGKEVKTKSLQGKLIAIYISAGWCPHCKEFTPKLIELRDAHQEELEVVFVSRDRSGGGQHKYMRSSKMPWPAMKYDQEQTRALQERFGVKTIPALIVLDASGKEITRGGVHEVRSKGTAAFDAWKVTADGRQAAAAE